MKAYQLASIGIVIGIVLSCLGIAMRILHWSLFSWFVLGGAALIVLSYLYRFLLKATKAALDIAKLGVAIMWCSNFVFSLLQLSYGGAVQVFATLSVLVFFALYIRKKSREKDPNLVDSVLSLVAAVGILGSAVFNQLHLSYARELMIVGNLALAFIVFQSIFKDPNKLEV